MNDFDALAEEMSAEVGQDMRLLPAFMTIVLLFAAAVAEANRDQKRALHEARETLKSGAPLPDVARAIFDAMGSDWEIPDATMEYIARINHTED